MKYKVLLSDVDGTLIPNTENGMPSERVIKTIQKAHGKIAIGIATARSYWQIAHILDAVDFTAPCIITGGAQVIDPITRKTFIERNISVEDVETVAAIGREMDIDFIVADRDGERPYDKNTIPERPLDLYTSAMPMEKADAFIRLISHISTISTHKALAWGDTDSVHVTIGNPEATKNDGVAEVAKLLGISTEEIIGIGEGYNDFPFLMACGLKIAMGNAVDDVKAIADYVAPSVEDDGVAHVIEKFVLNS